MDMDTNMDTDGKINQLLRVLALEDDEPGAMGRTISAAYALARLGQPGIEALARVLRDWGDYNYVAFDAAIEALGESGDTRAVVPLRNVMRMPPRGNGLSQEWSAARALARLEGNGVNALADITQMQDIGPETRWAAAAFLGKTGDEETALAPLLATLRDREDPLAAAGAATSLGELHSTEAIPALIAALDDEEYEFVANAAQGALYHIGEAAIPALVQAQSAVSDMPDKARRRAAWALSWLGKNEQARNALLSALSDPDADVRAAAVCAMRNHGDDNALPALRRIHQEDEAIDADFDSLAELAAEAIQAIEARAAGIEYPPPRDEESAEMDDSLPDSGVPPYMEDISLGGDDTAPLDLDAEVARLVSMLTARINGEEDAQRSVGAALSLARLGPQGLAALATVARNPSYDDDVRAAALDGLVSSGDETVALAPLFDVLNNVRDSWLGLQAANALGALASPAAIPGLIEALTDDQIAGSGLIENAFVRIGEAAIPALVAVLTDGPEGQRRAAARALREMSAHPQAATAFYAALGDPDPKVRELAIEAIASPHDGPSSDYYDDSSSSASYRDDPVSARALLPLLDDAEEPVRAAARNGLRAVGGPDDAALLARVSRFSGDMESDDDASVNTEIAVHLRLLAGGAGGDKDLRTIWRASQALSRLGLQGLAALGAVLRDPDLYLRTERCWAIDALGASGDSRAIPPLLDALRNVLPDSSVEGYFTDLPEDRRLDEELRAAYALARLGAPGTAALLAVSREPDISDRTRWAIRDALASLHGDTDVGSEPPNNA